MNEKRALLVVIALAVASVIVARRYLPRGTQRGLSAASIVYALYDLGS